MSQTHNMGGLVGKYSIFPEPHEGDVIVRKIIYTMRDMYLGKIQMEIGKIYLSVYLRYIYGDEFEIERERVMKKFGLHNTNKNIILYISNDEERQQTLGCLLVSLLVNVPMLKIALVVSKNSIYNSIIIRMLGKMRMSYVFDSVNSEFQLPNGAMLIMQDQLKYLINVKHIVLDCTSNVPEDVMREIVVPNSLDLRRTVVGLREKSSRKFESEKYFFKKKF